MTSALRFRPSSALGRRASGPIHLLVAGISWPPETFLGALLHGLLKAGFSVTVATSRRPDESWAGAGLRWLSISSGNGPRPVRLLRRTYNLSRAALLSPRGLVRVARIAEGARGAGRRWEELLVLLPFCDRSFDLVYFPWNAAAVNHLGVFQLGAPVVVSCRGSHVNVAPHDPRRLELRDGMRETFRRAAAVHCVSDSIRREALEYGLEEEKAHVIRPAVDLSLFPTRDARLSDDGRMRLLSVGSLLWVKGHEYALRAAAILKSEGVPVSLQIVGDGPDRQRLLYTIQDLGLTREVKLAGRLPHAEVRERLRESDLFLLASLSEGISNAALEAMATGLPVVTTNCGGMREVVTDGIEGLVVPLRRPREMARAIASLWRDRRLRASMGAAARARIVASFDLDFQVARFADLFRSLVPGTSNR